MKSNHITYIEFKAKDIERVKSFYRTVFEWEFTDYGPTYTSFSESGVAGGFEKSDEPIINGALVVLYNQSLEKIKEKVIANVGKISKDIFSFPGGRRFHFTDPEGNELAVWSDN